MPVAAPDLRGHLVGLLRAHLARLDLRDTETTVAPWRDERPLEQRLDMAAKRRNFDDAARQLAAVLGDGAEAAWTDLAERVDRIVRGGLHPNDIAGVAVSEPVQRALRDNVARVLRQAHRVGQADAARDVVAQAKPARLSATIVARAQQTVVLAVGDGLIGAEAERYFEAKSFYVTGVLLDDMIARAKAVLFNALRAPKPAATILADLSEQLAPFIPERDAAGRAVNVPARLETIARTNTAEAVNEGRWATFNDPDLEGVVEAFEYSAILDDRVRPNHRAWDGVTKAAEFWLGPPDRRPPVSWNCRCTLLPVILDAHVTPDDALPSEELVDPGFK